MASTPRRNNLLDIHRIPAQPAISIDHSSEGSPSSLSLSNLGTDILSIIVSTIQRDSPRWLSSVALVNAHFYHLARYSRFQVLSLDLGAGGNEKSKAIHALATYLDNATLLPAVRELRIFDLRHPRDVSARDSDVSHLSSLVPKLPGLTDIIWHHFEPIPPALLAHLHTRPKVRLHARALRLGRSSSRSRHGPRDHLLHVLEHCANLCSLEVTQSNFRSTDCFVHSPLRRILLSCPNLRRLRLVAGAQSHKCVMVERPQQFCSIGFLEGETPLAALEELELALPVMRIGCGKSLSMRELEPWVAHFDWSNIKRLVAPAQLGLTLVPQLTSLRHVSLWGPLHLATFYGQLSATLESITIATVAGAELACILRHGPTLRKLRIHQSEGSDVNLPADPYEQEQNTVNWAADAVSLNALHAIREYCPLIQELSIDLARDGAWPWDAFDVLASFPHLRRLELWFELGAQDPKRAARPHATYHTAREIARHLLDRAPPSLRTIVINSGAPRHDRHELPMLLMCWLNHQSASFVCEVSERHDEAVRRVFSTTFAGETPAGNRFLAGTEPGLGRDEFERCLADFNKTTDDPVLEPEPGRWLYGYWNSGIPRTRDSVGYRRDHVRLAYGGPLSAAEWDRKGNKIKGRMDWRGDEMR